MSTTKEIIEKLRAELSSRRLYKDVAEKYGCHPSYVSNVLTGRVSYNSKLIEICVEILEQAQKEEKEHINRVSSKIFS